MQNEEIMALNEKKEDELGRRGRLETFFLLTLQWIIGMTLFSNLLPNQIISKLEPLEQNANYSIRLHRNGIISITMTMEKSKVNLFFFFLWMSFCNKEESFVELARERRRVNQIETETKKERVSYGKSNEQVECNSLSMWYNEENYNAWATLNC